MSISTESDEQSLEAETPNETPAEMSPALAAEADAAATESETTVPPDTKSVPQDDAAQASAADTEATVDPILAESKEPISKEKPSPKKQLKPSSRNSQKNQQTVRQVTDRFAACGRCSYFWAGYKVIYGEEALATAVAQSESGWLDLAWNLQMPELILKSYGVRLDITHFHYEGCCKECRRSFVYEATEAEGEPDSFKIGISPRTS